MKNPDGSLDMTGYGLCILDGFAALSANATFFRFGRFAMPTRERGLLSGVAWEAARPAICRTVGVSVSPDEELGKLSRRLDLAYRETAERVPENTAVTIVNTAAGPDLSVERLEKIDEPASLIALRMAVDARLSTLDLSELFLEMHVRTG
ncbi:hypothetical protein ELI54_34170 [Rhizobium ruizarguesonis]|uniref:hypothetical protein n=1 Tax=Rhizobium ruizarguesonis TaxID=2081791 RepID=UPI001031E11D|nr:hypothetical protein [Rhizobium ruizarguesonis]NEH75678.1 hypothetical protein [Rhizobium ruizarguesonis]NEJ16688.1 hypothetical protein [Rhizobium ruizarguesonis]NEJ85504.1 hypothetical protein [Rhizobium ruizarguesonis]NEJ96948.1 hypothetical protein [Rhizobium ruizarguesonis]NEK30492.1 hypothetical protein [Rhizobium ruizarguesonis]